MTGDVITAITALGALSILGVGYYRARPYGRLGIFSWLQSVSLMVPWLVFFGLFAAGVYLSFVGILFLLVGSTIVYILLGRQVRLLSQQEIAKRAKEMAATSQANASSEPNATESVSDATTEVPAAPVSVKPQGPNSPIDGSYP